MADATNGTILGTLYRVQSAKHNGRFQVLGHTTHNGQPCVRRVNLYTPYGALVRGTYSTLPDGAYSFIGIAAGNYLVCGIDTSDATRDIVYNAFAAIPI